MESSYPSPSSKPADNHAFDLEELVSELHSLRNLYGLLQKNTHQSITNHFLDEKSRDLLKKLLDGATLRALNSQAKIISGTPETPKYLLNKPEQAEEECRKYQPAAPPASEVAATAKIFSPVEQQGITETPLPLRQDDDSTRRDPISRPSGSQSRRKPSEPSKNSSRRVKGERDGSALVLADRSCSEKGCEHLALVPVVPPASEVAATAKIFSPVEQQGITETALPVRKDDDSARRGSISRPSGSQSRRKPSEPSKNPSRRVKEERGGSALADRRSCSEKRCEHLALVPAVPPASEVAATAKIFLPVEQQGITETQLPVRKDDDSTRRGSINRPSGSQSRRKPSEPSKNPSRRVKDERDGSALFLADRRSCSEKGGENQALVPAQKRARVDAPSRTRKGGRVDRELTHRKRASAAAMVKPSELNRKCITSAGGQAPVVQQMDQSPERGSRVSKPEQKLLKQPEPASPRQMNRLPPNRSKARRFNSVSSSSTTSTSPAESEPGSSRKQNRVESRRAAPPQCITSRRAIHRREKALKRMPRHPLPSAALVQIRRPTLFNSASSSTSPTKSKPSTPRRQSRVKRRSAVPQSIKNLRREKALQRMPRDHLPSAALVPRRQPPSWQRRAAKAPKEEAEKDGTGRLRRFMKDKFAVIFHHHHHHHHHLHDGENENGGDESSPWNYLKSLLHFRSGGRKVKGQHGYWHAMLEGLLRHIRGLRRRRAERRRLRKAAGGRRVSKKLRWWHWFRRRGGVALRSRRRLRLGFTRSSRRRTAAGKP